MTRVQVAMTLLMRCIGAVALFHGLIGLAYHFIAVVTLAPDDLSRLDLHGRLISALLYLLYGVILLLISRRLVILLSRGLDEKE
jgi:hypothetical protein